MVLSVVSFVLVLRFFICVCYALPMPVPGLSAFFVFAISVTRFSALSTSIMFFPLTSAMHMPQFSALPMFIVLMASLFALFASIVPMAIFGLSFLLFSNFSY